MDALLSALGQIFVPSNLILLVLGVLIGCVVGLLPGLGAIPTLALMLPFTFSMNPYQAFALMLGMYAVVTTTGDLTAILFGVPGTPDCAALVLDGYPMTKKGMATRAMTADIVSGTIGAVIGAFVLAATVPLLKPIILHVGAPETLMLTMIGIVVIASVSDKSLLRGVITGGFGLLLAAVGPNAQTGIFRYTFDWPYLLDGLPLVAFAIGLFAIPELISMHASGASVSMTESSDTSTVRQGLADTVRHMGLVVRSSLVGVGFGVIPGVGSSVGQWAAYAHAKQTSKTPEEFGHGSIEGVIAPGATNNSKEGAGLIPTVAFGVPNGGAMAVLLGAFLILGLQPGPSMLTTHLDITLFLVWVLVAANILGSIICLAGLGLLAKLTFVKANLLFPFIAILVFLGAGSATGQYADVAVAVVAGLVSLLLRRYEWPIVPLVLGFVLGDAAESNLNISVSAYGWEWLKRPGVLGLGALVLCFLVFSIRQRHRMSVASGPGAEEGIRSSVGGIVLSGCAFVFAAAAVVQARDWPTGARLYPQVIGTVVAVCTLIALGQEVVGLRRGRTAGVLVNDEGHAVQGHGSEGARQQLREVLVGSHESVPLAGIGGAQGGTGQSTVNLAGPSPSTEPDDVPLLGHRSVAMGIAWILAGAVGVGMFGFTLMPAGFVLAYLRLAVGVSWMRSVAVAAVTGVVVYIAFVHFLDVALATGWVT